MNFWCLALILGHRGKKTFVFAMIFPINHRHVRVESSIDLDNTFMSGSGIQEEEEESVFVINITHGFMHTEAKHRQRAQK